MIKKQLVKKTIKRVFSLIIISFLFSCEKPVKIQVIQGFAQGTTYTIQFWLDSEKIKSLKKNILADKISTELARVDKLMSNYRDDSDIEVFNKIKTQNQPIKLDTEIIELLKVSKQIHKLSDGCYDPTVSPLFAVWGFRAKKFTKPSEEKILETLEKVGFDKIKLQTNSAIKENKETTVGLSAIGQGYAIKKVSQILEKQNIKNYIVEIGGEMLVSGVKPKSQSWKVGVEKPILEDKKVSKLITISGKKATAVMTSGTYRHYFDDNGVRYSHILDPKTGRPITHNTVSTTVLLEDATKADAWSTALLCLGSEKGLEIANKNKIPVIFFDLTKDNKLTELRSNNMTDKNEFWEVK